MSEKQFVKISLEKLETQNYRDVTDDFADIQESMLGKGQLEPLTVTPKIENGKVVEDRYIIVNGERRFRAAKSIVGKNLKSDYDFSSLECIVDTDYNFEEKKEDFRLNQLIFNEVKKGTTFETYLAVRELVNSGKYTKSQISKALGKDDSWAGKITSLLIDHSEFECYFSGNDLFYNKRTRAMYYSVDEFFEAEKENITATERDKVKKFLESDIHDQKEFEEKEGAIFEQKPFKQFTIYKGFGSNNAPSLWVAESLVNFYNDFCLDGQSTQAAGLELFSKIIRTLMRVGSKSKKDIDRLVEKSRRAIAGEPEQQPKEHEPVNTEKVAKAIFNLFKDIQFTEDEIKEVKRALKEILKVKENKDRVFVDIKISVKKELEQDPEDAE